ncbi:phage/plasmid primase, P4 family [Candidatus Methylacidithermus pantelleriae]|uniref:phage/plasmid primase, P4 family n=1 Tax=Candidatus Methylacidithermus pantelleriae TaxID=2744239 RepID=UPI001BD630E6|nr:phage/plasmid primase, P4 family [Candidatus Methylacidithermus pantelleriae]
MPGTKKPVVKGWVTGRGNVDNPEVIKGWVRQGYNVGIVLGRKGTLDVDVDEPGLLSLLEKALPPTGVVFGRKSRQGKGHFLYRVKGDARHVCYLDEDGKTLVELRWMGHQTAVPPSRLCRQEGDGPSIPEEDEVIYSRFGGYREGEFGELSQRVEEGVVAFLLSKFWPGPSSRHNAYRALAGGLKNAKVSLERVKSIASLVALLTKDEEPQDRIRCVEDTYTRDLNGKELEGFGTLVSRLSCDEKRAKRVVWRIKYILGIKSNGIESNDGTDDQKKESSKRSVPIWVVEVGTKVKEKYQETLKYTNAGYFVRYSKEERVWISSDPSDKDSVGRVAIQEYLNEMAKELPFEGLLRYIIARDLTGRIAKWYKNEPDVQIHESMFDRPQYVNLKNAVLELVEVDGKLRAEVKAQEPWHYCSRQAPVEYDPGADCPRWREFVEQICVDEQGNRDREKEDWLQLFSGYTLLPGNPEQLIFLFWGSGANGKSVFLDVLGEILGKQKGYYWVLASDAFAKARRDTHPSAYYPLSKVRLALAPEVPPHEIDSDLVKLITGEKTFDARRMRQDHENLSVRAKVCMLTNHMPHTKDVSYGNMKRYCMVPFYASFVDADHVNPPSFKRDLHIRDKLLEERSGILNWMLEGERRWCEGARLSDGVPSIKEFTAQCIAETSPFMAWFSMAVVKDDSAEYDFGEVYDHYSAYVRENFGEREVSRKQDFGKLLHKRGVRTMRRGKSNKTFVKGIKLLGLGEIL